MFRIVAVSDHFRIKVRVNVMIAKIETSFVIDIAISVHVLNRTSCSDSTEVITIFSTLIPTTIVFTIPVPVPISSSTLSAIVEPRIVGRCRMVQSTVRILCIIFWEVSYSMILSFT